jgi:YHS domain-containing protein
MIFSVTDPVCRTNIKKRNAFVKLKYKDKTYFFCSTRCKKTFAKMPKKYLPEKHFQDRNVRFKKKKKKRGCCG